MTGPELLDLVLTIIGLIVGTFIGLNVPVTRRGWKNALCPAVEPEPPKDDTCRLKREARLRGEHFVP